MDLFQYPLIARKSHLQVRFSQVRGYLRQKSLYFRPGMRSILQQMTTVVIAIGVLCKTVKLVYTEVMAESMSFLDTHETIRKLVKSGMPESQAETVVSLQVQFLERNFALKTDIEAFRQDTKADIEALRQDTKADIEALRQGTKADIEALRQETKADIEALRQETKAEIATTNANIETLRLETRADIEALRQETKTEIAVTNANIETLRLETKANIETLRQETEKLIALGKSDTIRWFVGVNVGLATLLITTYKYL